MKRKMITQSVILIVAIALQEEVDLVMAAVIEVVVVNAVDSF